MLQRVNRTLHGRSMVGRRQRATPRRAVRAGGVISQKTDLAVPLAHPSAQKGEQRSDRGSWGREWEVGTARIVLQARKRLQALSTFFEPAYDMNYLANDASSRSSQTTTGLTTRHGPVDAMALLEAVEVTEIERTMMRRTYSSRLKRSRTWFVRKSRRSRCACTCGRSVRSIC